MRFHARRMLILSVLFLCFGPCGTHAALPAGAGPRLDAVTTDRSPSWPEGEIPFSARVLGAEGAPASGLFHATFTITDPCPGGEVLWSETHDLLVTGGALSVELGRSAPIPDSLLGEPRGCLAVRLGTGPAITAGHPLQALVSPPHVEGSKSITPSQIHHRGVGMPDEATVEITLWGAGDPTVRTFPQDTILTIDSSGSMVWSDPFDDRKVAAKHYVDLLDGTLPDRAAIVDMDDRSRLVRNHHLSSDYPTIQQDVDYIDSDGGTDQPAAMAVANGELLLYGWPGRVWAVILLTDGQNFCLQPPYWGVPCPPLDQQMDDPTDPLVLQAIQNGILYFTIGLGTDVNEYLLRNLADMTGGEYFYAPTPAQLDQIYDKIHTRIANLAGKDISVYEPLAPNWEFVPGSFSAAPDNLTANSAHWTVPSLSIGQGWTVTFRVRTRCGNDGIVDGDTLVSYIDPDGASQAFQLPPVGVGLLEVCGVRLDGMPADRTVECSDPVPWEAPAPGATCTGTLTFDFREDVTPGNCPDRETILRTWTVTDECGNTARDTQTIQVVDTTLPVLAGVPPDATVECDAVPAPASPTAGDNCDPNPRITYAEARTNGSCPDTYRLTRTWTATDRCNNSSSRTQTIDVSDTQAPVLSGVPGDVTVECDAVPPPASPTAGDNCDPAPTIAFAEVRTDGNCPGNYLLTRTWTATDRCTNASSATQLLTVRDTTPPVIDAGSGGNHCLWPSNHWYVCLGKGDFAPAIRDNCSDPITWGFSGCASDQPDDANGVGDGHTVNDCLVSPGAEQVCPRSERDGTVPAGRHYGIAITAADACGNRSAPVGVGDIYVPHDQSPHEKACLDATHEGCRPNEPVPCGRR